MSRMWNLVLPVLLLLGLQACSHNQYLSRPATPEFRIDGTRNEWSGRFEILKKEKFAMGISHDKNYLYLAISSMDPIFQRQLALRGLTIWIDVTGKEHENLGFKFESRIPRDQRSRAAQMRQLKGPRSALDPGMQNRSLAFNGDLDLIVIDGDGRERLGPPDLLASATADAAGLFLEYQIPQIIFGPGFDPDKVLGVGITSEFDRGNLPQQGNHAGKSGGSRGGGMAGGRGGSQGGRGGGQSSMMNHPDQTDLDVWFEVQLTHP